jgi:hypothetical protein
MGCKVFISHATSDADLVDAIVRLLEGGIGVPYAQIFCSSQKGQGIRPGVDFKEDIRKNLDDATVVLAVVSQNFYASQFCLCELGGVWLKAARTIPLLVPPLKTSELSAVVAGVQVLKLEAEDLDLFRDEVVKATGIAPNGTPRWTARREEFLKALPQILGAIKHEGPVARPAHTKVAQERDDYRAEVERLKAEVQRVEKLNAVLMKAKDAAQVAKVVQEHSTTPKQFEHLVTEVQESLLGLRDATREAMYQELRRDVYRPDSNETWAEAKRAAEEGEVEIEEDRGLVVPRGEHPSVDAGRAALSELQDWLEAAPEDFNSWYDTKYKGAIPDISLRPFWKKHFRV